MKRASLKEKNVAELLQLFVSIALEQDDALLMDEIGRFNRLFDKMQAVVHELRAREGDQRRALLSLYDHPNMQVRVKAAKATLAIVPEAARGALEAIRASKVQPQALEAGMSLWNLDRGVFKPT